MALKGIPVGLHVKTRLEDDDFGRPVYEDTIVTVENVLVMPESSSDVIDSLNLTAKKISYVLCIPKGDTNVWEDTKVEFFGETFSTVGFPEEYIEDMTPLEWNKKVRVERYG